MNITEARIYVSTYRKYNNGSISGEWLNLSDYSDKEEFFIACKELHDDEEDPEFMFQDYENIPTQLISECWLSDNIFDVLQAMNELDEHLMKPFSLWCNNRHHDLSKENPYRLISLFENDYIGEYASKEDFARELVEQCGDLNQFALTYFDYQAYANDLFIDGYWFEDGYVFTDS
ncbi:antirestriction protein ArdA [Chryseobacterium gallinarum]|uniref:antirestriction protein ArdA n=1 Tax=Chryseobacterium gallinarum TaxID=1324352 RepID=UPI002024FF32|nr:antirestriction protein ArdA [Chryseobacterium gallinarum]MCL8537660.1 antirestriction protein ArdA [Chryseobacterium gallinarum]